MKPVLVLQHIDNGGPGLFAEYLRNQAIPFEIRRPDRGDPVPGPGGLHEWSGICLCGGTQCANDPLAWIESEIDLIRAASAAAMPVIGHCLGGQLISKALGGEVLRNAVVEFGWQELLPESGPVAGDWLEGMTGTAMAMQWHYDSYTDPPGAVPILRGRHCHNQAFVHGNMLAMQFHVELTEPMVRHWAVDLKHLIPPGTEAVQSAAEVLSCLPRCLPLSRRLAESLYARWAGQLR